MPVAGRRVVINENEETKEEKFQAKAAKAAEEAASEAAAASRKGKDGWKVPARYEVRQLLGSGSYGQVCEAKDRDGKRRVAIKQAHHLLDDLIDGKRVLREIAILQKLDHSHIVKLFDVVVPCDLLKFNEIYMVLELCDSDLKKLLRAEVHLKSQHTATLIYNLLVGLSYLHSAGIWHRDLKPANCLVNEDCSLKICDFGLARAVGGTGSHFLGDSAGDDRSPQRRHLTGHVVTRWYRAPELILLQESYTEAIDIWSAGCIYAELLGMHEPVKFKERAPLFPGHTCFPLSPHEGHKTDTKYYTKGTKDQLAMICNLIGTPSEADIMELEGEDAQQYMRFFTQRTGSGLKARFGELDGQGAELLEKMLVFNAKDRINAAQALAQPIFASVRDTSKEKTAKAVITLDFEQEEKLDERFLRRLFLNEVRRYHPETPDPEALRPSSKEPTRGSFQLPPLLRKGSASGATAVALSL